MADVQTLAHPITQEVCASESGFGWCDNEMAPFFPGVPCVNCGKFIGRDGHFDVEHFEMSLEIASVDGECGRCLRGAF
jgi:hypothetical protein